MQNVRSLLCLVAVCAVAGCTPQISVGTGPNGDPGPLPPDDPQVVRDQDDMTWDDYRPIPGVNWADTSRRGTKRTMRVAIVPADYSDYPFVVTQPKGSDQ